MPTGAITIEVDREDKDLTCIYLHNVLEDTVIMIGVEPYLIDEQNKLAEPVITILAALLEVQKQKYDYKGPIITALQKENTVEDAVNRAKDQSDSLSSSISILDILMKELLGKSFRSKTHEKDCNTCEVFKEGICPGKDKDGNITKDTLLTALSNLEKLAEEDN